jgi:hypothetical protein
MRLRSLQRQRILFIMRIPPRLGTVGRNEAITPEVVGARRVPAMIVLRAKSSELAVVLSFFWSGLGQIYNGQVLKGMAMMIAVPVLGWIGLASAVFGSLAAANGPSAFATAGLGVMFGGLTGLGALTLWIYGMVNAYRTAERINRPLVR